METTSGSLNAGGPPCGMKQLFVEALNNVEEALKQTTDEETTLKASKNLQELLNKEEREGGVVDPEKCRSLSKSLFAFLSGLETLFGTVQKALLGNLLELLDFCGVSVINELLTNTMESLQSAIPSSKIFLVESDESLEFLRKKVFSYCSKVLLYSLVALKGSVEQQQELINELTRGKAITRISKPLRKPFLPQLQVKYSSKSDWKVLKESKSSTREFEVFEYQRLAITQTANSIYHILSKLKSCDKHTYECVLSFLNLAASDYCEQAVLIDLCECILKNSNALRLEVSLPAHIISYSKGTVKVLEFLGRYILRAIRKSRVSCREYHNKWLRLYAHCMFEKNKDSFINIIKANEWSSGEILNQLVFGKCSIQLPSIVHEIESLEDINKLNVYVEQFCRLICNHFASNKTDLATLHHLLLLGFIKDDEAQKRQHSTLKKSFSSQLHSQLSCFEVFLQAWKAGFLQSLPQQSCFTIFHDIASLESKVFDVELHSPFVVDRLALLLGSCASIIRLLEIDSKNKSLGELRDRIIQKCLVFKAPNLRYASCNYLAGCGALDSGLRESLITELLQLLKISDLELYSPSHKRLSSLEFRQLYGSLLSRLLGYAAGITCLLLEEKDELGLPGGLLGQIFSDAIGLLRPHVISKVSLPQTAESIRRRAGWILIAALMETRVARFLESSHLTRLLHLWQVELSFLRNNVDHSKAILPSSTTAVSEFSAQEASLAAARLSSLAALYYLLKTMESRERPANFDHIVSVLISASAVRVAEVWQALQRDEDSSRKSNNVRRMFSLCEVYWLSRCSLLLRHTELSVDACLRVSLAVVQSHGKVVTPEVVEDSKPFSNYFQLISFFGSLGAELPTQGTQLDTAIDCCATLLTAERGRHPIWIELSFPISTKDYLLSPLIGSKFGYTYASEFRIQKRALDGWCLSRLQASLWVALDVSLLQRLEERPLSPWSFCMDQQEMSTTIFYMTNAFVELAKNGDTQLRHEFIVNLCRLSEEKVSGSSSTSSLYEIWRRCICVLSLSLLCSDESIALSEADTSLVKNAIYSALDSSHTSCRLASLYAAMEASFIFMDEPEQLVPKIYSVWKCEKDSVTSSYIRTAVYRWINLLSSSFWHAQHYLDGTCIFSICTLTILNEFVRGWLPTWLKENSVEMLEICEVILWSCSEWKCPIVISLVLDISSWIWNWMETNSSIDASDEKRVRRIIPFKDETSLVASIVKLLSLLCDERQSCYGFILKHVIQTLSLLCESIDIVNILRVFRSLPNLLIEIMNIYDDYAVETSSLLRKLSLKGPCDFWFTVFFRAFRGGSKECVSLERNEIGRNDKTDIRTENTLERGLVSERDQVEFWQLKGRTRDLLMKCACCILTEGAVTLDFFVTNSVQLILASCQSLRLDSIIESFQLVRVLRQKLASDSEILTQGALLQLVSSIRSILNPQHHPMIVVAAAQASVETSLWNSVVDDELVDLIVPGDKINQLPNYWQYERWSEPVGVVTLFAMLRFASEWYYNQSLSSSAEASSSPMDLRPYALAVIGDFSFILSGYSWMFEKWGCSIGSDGVYRDKLSEVFWKHGTSFIHNMILVLKLRLLEENDPFRIIWKQTSSPGVQLAEKMHEQEKKKDLILSIHLAWLKHLIDECPASQETQQFISCFESNLMLSFLYDEEDHRFLNIIWNYLGEKAPLIMLQVFCSVVRFVCDDNVLLRMENQIVDSFGCIASACRKALFDDTNSVLEPQLYLSYKVLVSPIQLVDETLLLKYERLRKCFVQMFIMGICGYFHCLSRFLRTEKTEQDTSQWLAEWDKEASSASWKQNFQLISKWVDPSLANNSLVYCVEELLKLRPVISKAIPAVIEKLVSLLYAMIEHLPVESKVVKSSLAEICSGLDGASSCVSYNWLTLLILPGVDIFAHRSPELLALLWRCGWKYMQNDTYSVEDAKAMNLAWMRIYIRLMGISKMSSPQTSVRKKYFDTFIIKVAIDMILSLASENCDEKMSSLENDLLWLAKKDEEAFRTVIHSLQEQDRLALQEILRHATK